MYENELKIEKTKNKNVLIILEKLINQKKVKIEKTEYVLAKTKTDGYKLCMLNEIENQEKIVLSADMSIGSFITLCEKIKEEDIQKIKEKEC